MQTRFITQPWDGADQRTADDIVEALSQESFSGLTVVVAFAKRGGVRALEDPIRQFLARGSGVEVFVGIDARGTSKEALDELLALGVPVHVFHNPGSTFHPKLYLLESEAHSYAIVGSSNLTPGGLYTNYELNVALTLDHTDVRDRTTKAQLSRLIDNLRGSLNTKDLTQDLLEELERRGALGSESDAEAAAEAASERRRLSQALDMFPRTSVPAAPRAVRRRRHAGMPAAAVDAVSQFVMIMGTRDTRHEPGYSRDIYIPLAARDAHLGFWRWPDNYVHVTGTSGDYFERRVNMLVQTPAGPTFVTGVRVYRYQQRSEFRLNCSALVDQADVGDLLVIELPQQAGSIDYLGNIVKQNTPEYTTMLGLASTPVPNSTKRWGYA